MATKIINQVQIDGLVLMKIIKHCQEEVVAQSFGGDVVQGVLVGLAQNDILEVTNCFPLPKSTEEEAENSSYHENSQLYITDMVKNYRMINLDYLVVGFYQSSFGCQSLNRISIDSLYNYQFSLSESIMLLFDPSRTGRGQIQLRAFCLTPTIEKVYQETTITVTAGGAVGAADKETNAQLEAKHMTMLDGDEIFRQLPVSLRNSHLINALIGDLAPQVEREERSFATLDLGVGTSIERQLKLMLEGLELGIHNSQIQLAFQKQQIKASTQQSGRDLTKNLLLPSAVDTNTLAVQLSHQCRDLSVVSGQTLGKLRLVHGLHSALMMQDKTSQ